MNRRAYLSAVAVGGLAGCSQLTGGLGGPKYEDVTREDLLLSTSDFPDDWKRNDSYNDNFDAVFLSADESIVVLQEATVYESTEGAEDSFGQVRGGFRDPQDMDIGDEAFWDTQNEQLAYCAVRDGNVAGAIGALRESGLEVIPAQTRAQQYAGLMVEGWREL